VITTDDIAANAVTFGKIGTTEQGQLCKAWVNFNGTGTVAIRAAYNVSSITDNGTGDYTVNFTTALADANYTVVGSSGTTASDYRIVSPNFNAAPTGSACRIRSASPSSAGPATDDSHINVAIFR
jgi:hypothetical protein